VDWILHADVTGNSTRYPLAGDSAVLGAAAGPGRDFDSDDPAEGPWVAGGLQLSLVGEGPSYDLGVQAQGGGTRLLVTDVDLTMATCCHVELLDSVVMVEGDTGTSVSRSILLLSLAGMRAALAAGNSEISLSELDYERVRGASNQIQLDMARWSFQSPAGTREVFGYANVPRVQPPVAALCLVDHRGIEPGGVHTGVAALVKGGVELSGLWMSGMVCGRLADGRLRAMALGVVRKRRDFQVGLRVLTAADEDETLSVALRDSGFVTWDVSDIELRDASAIKAVTALPETCGCLLLVEDPYRKMHLWRLDVADDRVTAREIEIDPMPSRIRVTVGDAQGEDEAAETDDAVDGLLTVTSAGQQVELGLFAADATPQVAVYVVGDGGGAGLHWWLSQDEGDGQVMYRLHLRAERQVQVRSAILG